MREKGNLPIDFIAAKIAMSSITNIETSLTFSYQNKFKPASSTNCAIVINNQNHKQQKIFFPLSFPTILLLVEAQLHMNCEI